ncbi:uncharacterized protein LOC120347669 isoform X2 [Styela clava]
MDCITLEVMRKNDESWGLQISGESPCYIESVQKGSPAEEAGLEIGDYIISVNGVSVYDASHEHVVQLISDSSKIVRFRVLPNQNASNQKPVEDETQKSNSKSYQSSSNGKDAFEDSDSDTEEYFFNFNKVKKASKKNNEVKRYDLQVRYDKAEQSEKKTKPMKKLKSIKVPDNPENKEIDVEQSHFIITREHQKDFDDFYEHEGNFAGRRATVAGAFTGDFNVIRNKKEEDDIVGVKSRVLAGIQHFSLSEKCEKIAEEDRGKIILYTTSLGIHRSIAYRCEEARKILRGFRVKFEDRDVFSNAEYKDEIYRRLGLSSSDKFPDLPRLYIDGVYAGGFDEIQEMSDCGDLRIRFRDFPKYNIRHHCTSCLATGIVTCKSWKGKGFRQKNRFTTLKCGNCQQRGTVTCPDCF